MRTHQQPGNSICQADLTNAILVAGLPHAP